MTLFPTKSILSLVRFGILLIALSVCLLYVWAYYEIRAFDPKPGAQKIMQIFGGAIFQSTARRSRVLEPTHFPQDTQYAKSLINQLDIANTCDKFLLTHTILAAQRLGKLDCGIAPDKLRDPWDRPYTIRVLKPDLLVVASSGGADVDRTIESSAEIVDKSKQAPYFMVKETLVVTQLVKH